MPIGLVLLVIVALFLLLAIAGKESFPDGITLEISLGERLVHNRNKG